MSVPLPLVLKDAIDPILITVGTHFKFVLSKFGRTL